MEDPCAQLDHVSALIEQEREDEALGVLDSIVECGDDLRAHRLRAELLLKELKRPMDLRTSLYALHERSPDDYAVILEQVENQLYVRLSTLQDSVAEATSYTDVVPLLNNFDELAIFCDLFPVVQVARGLAYMTAARICKRKRKMPGRTPYETLRNLLSTQIFELPQQEDEAVPDEELDAQQKTWYDTGGAAFRTALSKIDADDPFAGEVYEALGKLYAESQQNVPALRAYQQAVALGREAHAQVSQLTEQIAEVAQQLALDRVDHLMGLGDLDAVESLLETYRPDTAEIDDKWLVRLAELAMLRGDYSAALNYYNQLFNEDKPSDGLD